MQTDTTPHGAATPGAASTAAVEVRAKAPAAAVYQFSLALAHNERVRAASLPPGPERDDAKGWCRDLLSHARKMRELAA